MMEILFKHSDYKNYLIEIIKTNSKRGYHSRIARAAGCQPAYLSQVLNGKKTELTEDHAFRISEFLKLTANEREYFLTLVQKSRSADSAYKNYLADKLNMLRKTQEQIITYITSEIEHFPKNSDFNYYLDASTSIIHLLTSTSKYCTVHSISNRLNMPEQKVNFILNKLIQSKLVHTEGNRYTFNSHSSHLPNQSEYNQSVQIQRRNLCIQSILKNDIESQIHYSSLFSLSSFDFEKLKNHFRKSIGESHVLIEKSPSEDVYGINIDVYRVV